VGEGRRYSGQVRVEVGDTGHGMSETSSEPLFKPFSSTKHSGMGIGSYESFQYIRELGGSHRRGQRTGAGHRRDRAAAAVRAQRHRPAALGWRMSTPKTPPLLIVEDDLALQKQIKWSLDRFESVTASDRESRRWCSSAATSPAVVTMDLGLPPDPDSVSEGFKLLEQMLDARPDVKVIVLTGQNDQANACVPSPWAPTTSWPSPSSPNCST
jgi:CheY-like chemotaxis protein